MITTELNVDEIVRRHSGWTVQWHEGPTPSQPGLPWTAIEQNHRMNFELWHEEDLARRDDLGAERVRQAKRVIDRCNQSRNDAIEQIDTWLLAQLPPAAGSPQHSETPGMIIDRLSILSLKRYHMRLEAERVSASEEHRQKCRLRCAILEEQARDLQRCVDNLLAELRGGTRHFKLYRQLKMYNDASLNPQLYGGPPKA
ncbi:MAG: DUF4254 domain-containing protein [Verrucomicrobia bacterium]|nr:DUF4254 domain-containing protein [Verrucomicrobiota bacterium]